VAGTVVEPLRAGGGGEEEQEKEEEEEVVHGGGLQVCGVNILDLFESGNSVLINRRVAQR
jgi:hypothetical protein